MAFAALSPLRHRSFAFAVGSSFVSSIGTWMQAVALGIYLFETTRNPEWLSWVTVAAWLPAIIGSPVGGAVADRWNRQRWIQLNNLIMALCATTLATLYYLHHLSPGVVLVLAMVEGLSSSSSWAAWQSLMPDLVGPDEVLGAVSLSSAQFNLGRIIGPVWATVLLTFGPVSLCFVANSVSFVVVMVAFAFVRTTPRPPKTTPFRLVGDIREGARAAVGNAACRTAIIGVALVAVVIAPFIQFIPAMAIGVFNAGKTGTSWLVTAQGVGAVLAAFAVPTLARRTSRATVLRGTLVLLTISIVGYGLAPSIGWAIAMMVLSGAAYMGTLNGLNATVQLHAPRGERSRVLSLYTLALSVGYPLGCAIQGVLAHTVTTLPVVTTISGVVGMVGVGALLLRRRAFDVMGAPVVTA